MGLHMFLIYCLHMRGTLYRWIPFDHAIRLRDGSFPSSICWEPSGCGKRGRLLAAFGKVSFCMSSIPIVCLGVILLPCSKWIALDQSQSKGSWCCQVSRLWGHWSSDQQLDHQYLPQWETRPLTICVHTLYIGELGQHSLVIPPPCRKPFLLLVVAVNVVVVVGVSTCGTSNVRSSGGAAAEVLKCLALQGPACMSLM